MSNIENNSFETKKAFHAREAAYKELANAKEKLNTAKQIMLQKYSEVEQLQASFDTAKNSQNEAWQKYNDAQLEMKEQIRQKILSVNECNRLEEDFSKMVKNPNEDPAKIEVYSEATKYFASMAIQKLVERDKLITQKRSMPRPNNYTAEQILVSLKNARKEHDELLEEYHHAKNELSIKQQNYDRLNEKYNDVRNNESNKIYTNRPERLEITKGLLVKAEIPEEYWDNCSMKKRTDGRIDVYYGGDEETSHGHVVLFDDKIEYTRQPETKEPVLVQHQ